VVTVTLKGVSLTNVLLHVWHAVAEMAFTVAPAVTVTAVGAVAEAIGMVNVPLNG